MADNQAAFPYASDMLNQAHKKVRSIRAALDGLARARKTRGWRTEPLLAPRPFGTMRGEIWLAPDFDDTPDELIALMENRTEPASSE